VRPRDPARGQREGTETPRRPRPRAWHACDAHSGSPKDSLRHQISTSCRNASALSPRPRGKRGPFHPPPPAPSPCEVQGNGSGPQVCRQNSSQTLRPKQLSETVDLPGVPTVPTVPSERGRGETCVPTQCCSQVKAGLGDPSWEAAGNIPRQRKVERSG